MFDFNRYRNSEILNEDIRDREGANELALKLIQTYANDTAKTNQEVPSPADQAILDRYITGFLNAVVFEYGKMVRGDEPNVETLITRWNSLATFFNNDINPLYSYYVINKLDNDIVARIDDLKEWNDRGDDEEGNLNFNVNKGAMDMLYRYTKNGVIRPIPYSLIYSKDDLSVDRLNNITVLENERRLVPLPVFGPAAAPAPAVAAVAAPAVVAPAVARRGRPARVAAPAAAAAAAAAASPPAARRVLPVRPVLPAIATRLVRPGPVRPASPRLRPAVRRPVRPAAAPAAAFPYVAGPPAIRLVGPIAPPRPVSPDLDLGDIGLGKPRKGRGKNTTTKHAHKDASLGRTPSGYTTSQSYPSRLSEKTVKASYGKGLPKGFVVF
jgi:hypothetical protein